MQPNMNWLEKMVLQNTVGILLALVVPLWLVQGDRSALDGTCVLNVPVPITSALFVSDLLLSAAYLYLFIQPLRETMHANEARRHRAGAGAAVTPAGIVRNTTVHLHVVSPIAHARTLKPDTLAPTPTPAASAALLAAGTATVPPSPSLNPSPVSVPTSPAGPAAAAVGPSTTLSINTTAAARHLDSIKLEAVMRRNTRAAVVAVAFSSSSMLFCMLAMIFDDPYMRKLVSPIALFVSHTPRLRMRASLGSFLPPHGDAMTQGKGSRCTPCSLFFLFLFLFIFLLFSSALCVFWFALVFLSF